MPEFETNCDVIDLTGVDVDDSSDEPAQPRKVAQKRDAVSSSVETSGEKRLRIEIPVFAESSGEDSDDLNSEEECELKRELERDEFSGEESPEDPLDLNSEEECELKRELERDVEFAVSLVKRLRSPDVSDDDIRLGLGQEDYQYPWTRLLRQRIASELEIDPDLKFGRLVLQTLETNDAVTPRRILDVACKHSSSPIRDASKSMIHSFAMKDPMWFMDVLAKIESEKDMHGFVGFITMFDEPLLKMGLGALEVAKKGHLVKLADTRGEMDDKLLHWRVEYGKTHDCEYVQMQPGSP